mmetsp:Transcript_13032/g.18751  ORF Transcript_13032/g.18751 Transcript_13032/m.18751 type:complete len:83 (+) Transcript_13032:788-1036(+)
MLRRLHASGDHLASYMLNRRIGDRVPLPIEDDVLIYVSEASGLMGCFGGWDSLRFAVSDGSALPLFDLLARVVFVYDSLEIY